MAAANTGGYSQTRPANTSHMYNVVRNIASFLSKNDEQSALQLLSREIHDVDKNGRTILNYVLLLSPLDVVKFVFSNTIGYFDPCSLDHQSKTTLHSAIRNPNPEVLNFILEYLSKNMEIGYFLQLINQRDSFGYTVLKSVADLMPRMENGRRQILTQEEERRRLEMARYLIRYGADPKIPDHQKRTVLFSSAALGSVLLFNFFYQISPQLLFLSDMNGSTVLHNAAYEGKTEIVKTILSIAPTMLTARDKVGNTPIMCAAFTGHTELVKLLYPYTYSIRNSADPDPFVNESGISILNAAASSGNSEMMSWLLAQPHMALYLNMADKNGFTPIHTAIKNGHAETFWKLFTAKALLTIPNTFGYTPVQTAEKTGGRIWDCVRSITKTQPELPQAMQQPLEMLAPPRAPMSAVVAKAAEGKTQTSESDDEDKEQKALIERLTKLLIPDDEEKPTTEQAATEPGPSTAEPTPQGNTDPTPSQFARSYFQL